MQKHIVIKRRVASNAKRIMLKLGPYVMEGLSKALRLDTIRMGRNIVARRYLTGRGLEIGAFAAPTMMPPRAHATYVDRVPASHWEGVAEYEGYYLIDPEVVEDATTLSSLPDNGYDFLVACHMLEHSPDPIRALVNWVRVVRPGGIVMIVVPDKRFTYDRDREITSFEHVYRDYVEGPNVSADEHYTDIARNIYKMDIEMEIADYVSKKEPAVHFHVWDLEAFIDLILRFKGEVNDSIEVLEMKTNIQETLVVLRVS